MRAERRRPAGGAPGRSAQGRPRARGRRARGADRFAAWAAGGGATGARRAASLPRADARRREDRSPRRAAAARDGAGAHRPESAAAHGAAGPPGGAGAPAGARGRHGAPRRRAARRPSGNVAGPGPDQMYDLSLQQFRRGSLATARIGFREFLRVYPAHDRAPDALFYVGETFAGESADSGAAVYQQVVKTYPNSSRAPSALYELGLLAEQRGDRAAARTYYARVIAGYPRSDEANLAKDKLQRLGR